MAVFFSKFKNHKVTLRGGSKKEINGEVVKEPEVSAKFKNGSFDTKSHYARSLPMKEKEIILRLRKNKNFGKDFWQPEKPPLRAQDLVRMSYRELNASEELKEADAPMLVKAIGIEQSKEEPRSTIIGTFKDELKKHGVEFNTGDDEEEGE